MKKMMSLILALMVVMSLSITTFADEDIRKSADVKGTYTSGSNGIVYSVDISWAGLEFTYNGASKGTWDPENHTYIGATEAGWADGEGTITVTNHSNTDITATPSYAAASGYESASMIFSDGENQIENLLVASADNGADGVEGKPVTGTITVTPTGSLPEGTQDAIIGRITISIN